MRRLLWVIAFAASAVEAAERAALPLPHELLPPVTPWQGRSRELAAAAGELWITPAERSGFRTSPSYDETFAWLRALVAAAPELRMISIGRSDEGRDIWMVVASRDRAFTADAMRRSGKPVVLAQAGIHAGEIDGKDAGLMLLRDMTVARKRRELLDRASFLFVPILNVDGHERSSRYGRVNQRGPEVMGWRTTSRNLNINRDYTKLDSPEARAIVHVIDRWKPDVYVDLHVTDGTDHQYDVMFGWNESSGWSPATAKWLASILEPKLMADLEAMGHIPGRFFSEAVWGDLSKGVSFGNAAARLSNGYGDARQLATVLVENHSLKPYDQRVLGMRVLLESILGAVAANGNALRRAASDDAARRPDPVPLSWRRATNATPGTIELAGIEMVTTLSPISGALRPRYTGKPVLLRVPLLDESEVAASARRPRAYWIPPAWSEVADRLRMHGIVVERIAEPREIEVEMMRLVAPRLASSAFEGRVTLTTGVRAEKRKERFPAGSFRVVSDQPLGTLAAIMLEAESPDSFLRWGFFHHILQLTEYIEPYAIEPLAEAMIEADPALAEEFRKRIESDEAFRSNSFERLRFFYERSPYFDERWLLYPVAKEY